MKKQLTLLLACLVISGARIAVHAGPIETVVIDEYGVGSWVDSSAVVHAFSGTFMADPSGGTSQALVYDTNVAGGGFTFTVRGDYRIYLPGTTELVGVVRFHDNHLMIFYDNDIGLEPSPADGSGMPATYMPFHMWLEQETPLGDPISAAVVTPLDGMAGYAGLERQYTFLSVLPVPEPGVISLLACSAVLLILRRRRPEC
jgi:hypothetical protein